VTTTTELQTLTETDFDSRHIGALASMATRADQIRYAAQVLHPNTAPSAVIAWLIAHGVQIDPVRSRSYVSSTLSTWHKARRAANEDQDAEAPAPVAFEHDRTDETSAVQTRSNAPGEPHPRAPRLRRALTALLLTGAALAGMLATQVYLEWTPWTPAFVPELSALQLSALLGAGAVALGTLAWAVRVRPVRRARREWDQAGTAGFYVAAFVCSLLSLETSWEFFAQELPAVDPLLRAAMFAVAEVALVAAGRSMYRAVRTRSSIDPGVRTLVWGVCVILTVMAWSVSGPVAGTVRALLGPILGVIVLHFALRIDVRTRANTAAGTTWTRVWGEVREWALSWLGLGDDTRTALTRRQERRARTAARRAFRLHQLKISGGSQREWDRATRRLQRALRGSNVAHDPTLRRLMLAELAMLRHGAQLADIQLDSPWHA
jgi:hypothetical protein